MVRDVAERSLEWAERGFPLYRYTICAIDIFTLTGGAGFPLGYMNKEYSLQELRLESTLGAEGTEDVDRDIPVISMRDFESRRQEITDSLWRAATEIGFFQLADHGINSVEISQAFNTAESFFRLDKTRKGKYRLKAGGLNAGWESKAQVRPSTGTADQKESFQLTRPHMQNLWPGEDEVPKFRSILETFESACWHLGMRVLSCFASKLGFKESFFSEAHNPEGEGYQCTLRMLHYYPVSEARVQDQYWRAGAHTDFDCLTLLFQRDGQHGLQVCPGSEASDGRWTSVLPNNDLITCNIGDMLMRWSDDRLKSTLHRVRMPKMCEYLGSRYSLAFFCQANKPIVIQGPQQMYEPITAEAYLKQRIAANFSY